MPGAASLTVGVLRVAQAAGAAEHTRQDQTLALEVAAIYAASRGGCYGSPRVHAELRERGQRSGRKRVARLMRAAGLRARVRRRYRCTTDSRHGMAIKGNLARRFAVLQPNSSWVTDITYLPVDLGRMVVSGGHPGFVLTPG